MMIDRRRVTVVALAFTALLASAPVAADVVGTDNAQAFRVCLDPHNPPFSMRSGPRHGIYYEVAERLAARLDRPLDVFWWPTNVGKRAIRLTVLEDRCDAMMGVPFEENLMGRRLVVAGPLLELGYAIVVPEHSAVRSLEGLSGNRVAVVFNTPAQNALAQQPGVESVTFRTTEQALAALASGDVDAAFVWDAMAGYEDQVAGHGWQVVPVAGPRMRWHSAIGVERADQHLRDRLQTLLEETRQDIEAIAASYGVRPAGATAPSEREQSRAAEVTPEARPAAAEEDRAVDVERGRKLFNAILGCSHCHGPDAKAPDRARDLRLMRSRYGGEWSDVYWENVLNGRTETVSGLVMPAWEDKASREELEVIQAYVDSLQEQK